MFHPPKDYGAKVRIFDAGDKVADRYTILPPRHDRKYLVARHWLFVSSTLHGATYHGEPAFRDVGPHLGKRVHWNDLTPEVQAVCREEFPEYCPATKTVRLILDRKERFNLKRGWFVNAWRLVNSDGQDLVQPWFDTKGEARAYAKAEGWAVVE